MRARKARGIAAERPTWGYTFLWSSESVQRAVQPGSWGWRRHLANLACLAIDQGCGTSDMHSTPFDPSQRRSGPRRTSLRCRFGCLRGNGIAFAAHRAARAHPTRARLVIPNTRLAVALVRAAPPLLPGDASACAIGRQDAPRPSIGRIRSVHERSRALRVDECTRIFGTICLVCAFLRSTYTKSLSDCGTCAPSAGAAHVVLANVGGAEHRFSCCSSSWG